MHKKHRALAIRSCGFHSVDMPNWIGQCVPLADERGIFARARFFGPVCCSDGGRVISKIAPKFLPSSSAISPIIHHKSSRIQMKFSLLPNL